MQDREGRAVMRFFRRILVPHDGSEPATRALKLAAELARGRAGPRAPDPPPRRGAAKLSDEPASPEGRERRPPPQGRARRPPAASRSGVNERLLLRAQTHRRLRALVPDPHSDLDARPVERAI